MTTSAGRTRLCFVADGRSPIARNWISDFAARGYDVHLVSTFPCDAAGLGLAGLHVVPAALGRLAGAGASRPAATAAVPGRTGNIAPLLRRVRARATGALLPAVLGWLAPLDLSRHARHLRGIVRGIDPALVHAMRVPYEGILAALALEGEQRPLVVSTWGNDLELWAARYPLVARLTRGALRRATALHADCARDLRLAPEWGWDPARPSAVFPGNGGVRGELFHAARRADVGDAAVLAQLGLADAGPLVVNARGFRGYVRNDTFFRAVPLVLARRPDVVFAGVGMRDHAAAARWVRTLGIAHAVRLLPALTPAEMGAVFRASTASVSPALYDGTPNTLLEAMACGALPVAGDIASVREWVEHGRNGLLFDPTDPRALADALVRALADAPLRARASERNVALVAERAEFRRGMERAEALYASALDAGRPTRARAAAGGAAGPRVPVPA